MQARLTCLDYALLQTKPKAFAYELLCAIRRDGFVLLENHPISQALRDGSFAAVHDFFALPPEEKNRININLSPNHRGYFAIGQENLDPAYHQGDYKEGLKIGRDLPLDDPLVQAAIPLHGPNQWPQVAGFRQQMERLFVPCLDMSEQLMQAFALALKLPQDYFAHMIDAPMATLAPLHYPRQTNGACLGAGAHTDFGCMTLLIQDGTSGLEVWNTHQQQWQQVVADPEVLVINIGDMLQRWSNDLLPSTRHRVNNHEDRYSFAFFFDPNYDAVINPIVGDNGQTALYPPITALAYLQQRIADSFAYFAQREQGTHSGSCA